MKINSNVEPVKWTDDITNCVISVFERPKYRFRLSLTDRAEKLKNINNSIKIGARSHFNFRVHITDNNQITSNKTIYFTPYMFKINLVFTEKDANITIFGKDLNEYFLDRIESNSHAYFRKGQIYSIRKFSVYAANRIYKHFLKNRNEQITSEVIDS